MMRRAILSVIYAAIFALALWLVPQPSGPVGWNGYRSTFDGR